MTGPVVQVTISASELIVPALAAMLDRLVESIDNNPSWQREDILMILRLSAQAVKEGK